MPGSDTTTLANAIREAYSPALENAITRYNSFLGQFPTPVPSPGETAYRFKIAYADNGSVETYTENQPERAAGYIAVANAYQAYSYFRGKCRVTGHLRDALKSQWYDALAEDMQGCQAAITSLINTTYISSTVGLALMIDSASNVFGITRSANTWIQSTETSVSAPLAITSMQDLFEAIRIKGGIPSKILTTTAIKFDLSRLTGTPYLQQGGVSDKGENLINVAFAGIPVLDLPEAESGILYALDMQPGKWVVLSHRDWQVKARDGGADADEYVISRALGFACRNPALSGKLTDIL